MNMSEELHNKIDIAVEQLQVSLKLFLSGESYVSALTLAGAAEEILGMALKIRGIENSLQEQFRLYHEPGLEWLNPPKKWLEFTTNGKNLVRNAVKHVKNAEDLDFMADISDEALWMLVRATANFIRLGFKPTRLMHEFDSWFHEHVVGI